MRNKITVIAVAILFGCGTAEDLRTSEESHNSNGATLVEANSVSGTITDIQTRSWWGTRTYYATLTNTTGISNNDDAVFVLCEGWLCGSRAAPFPIGSNTEPYIGIRVQITDWSSTAERNGVTYIYYPKSIEQITDDGGGDGSVDGSDGGDGSVDGSDGGDGTVDGSDGGDGDPIDPDNILPANTLFFDSFEGSVNARGTHGWSRILALDATWNPSDYNREIDRSTRFDYFTNFARFGDTSFRVTVHDGDHVVDSDRAGGNERAEIARRYLTATGEGTQGDERWYGLSVLIDRDFPAMPSNAATIVTQFLKENNRSAPYPNPTIDIRIKYRNGSHFLEVYNRELINGSWQKRLHNIGNLDKETWADLSVHVKWSTGNDGFWEVWRDGRLVASVYNKPTLPGIDHPTFQKIGLYRWNDPATYHVFYDGYWMGKEAPPYAK